MNLEFSFSLFVSKPFEYTCFMFASLLSATMMVEVFFFNANKDVLMLVDSSTWGINFQILWHLERSGGRTHKTLNFKPCFRWVTVFCCWKLKACKS